MAEIDSKATDATVGARIVESDSSRGAAETLVPRLPSPNALVDPAALEPILGAVTSLSSVPLATPGFSGSSHQRLTLGMRDGSTRTLVLKRSRMADDWLLRRTGDRLGREAMLVGDPGFSGVWRSFASPYLAWAVADGEMGLLMVDLADHLLPDVREPVTDAQEVRLLQATAAMHARFWDAPVLGRPWLVGPVQPIDILTPEATNQQLASGTRIPVLERAREGWAIALTRLPDRVAKRMMEPPTSVAGRFAHLPRTLTHGDLKIANFAHLPNGAIAAFDWAMAGACPVALDLGWHLAVNATRLPGSKEQSIARYRGFLESALGRALDAAFWRDTEALAVLAGALTMLWSKALALESGGDRARNEWDWWVARLEAI